MHILYVNELQEQQRKICKFVFQSFKIRLPIIIILPEECDLQKRKGRDRMFNNI